jgi:hypothetical protein
MDRLGRTRHLDLWDQSDDPGLHGVVCACLMLRGVRGSFGVLAATRKHEFAPLSARIPFRFALFQANQQIQNIAKLRGEEWEKRRLGLDLEKVRGRREAAESSLYS